MKRIVSTTLLFVFLGASALLAPEACRAQQSQKIILAGYKHEPPVRTSGSGVATVKLKNDTLKVSGEFEDLNSNFSGAYLMVSLKGKGGNQIYRLTVDLNEEKTGGSLKAKKNSFALTPAELELLKRGDLYINISSFDHQKGELRGNIRPMEN